MRLGSAAPWIAPIRPRTLLKQPAPNILWPASALRSHATSTSPLPEWEPLECLLRSEGSGMLLLRKEDVCICFGLTSGFCMNVCFKLFFFFLEKQLSTCFPVFGIVCLKPKLTHDECQKKNVTNVLRCIFIIFNYFPLERRV